MGVIEETSTKLQLHDFVELTNDVWEVRSGAQGAIIDAYPDKDTYTVEIADKDGVTVALVPCKASDLALLERY